MIETFDPFNDRTSRDIRNSLSTALVNQLTRQAGATVEEVAASWLEKMHQPVYHDYVHHCRKQYRKVSSRIDAQGIRDPRLQAVELWNGGLFFELHELLETVWHGAQGAERTGLKGLIQAAGAYVHRRRGNLKAARGLARRARIHLATGAQALGFVANLDTLMDSLETVSVSPPALIPHDTA